MNLDLEDKIVVVTGAGGMKGSIGETLVKQLSAENAIPVVLDRSDRGRDHILNIKKKGGQGLFIQVDLTQPDEIQDAIKKVLNEFGRIDVLINHVGINDGVGLDGSYDDFMYSLKLNLVSYWLTSKYCLNALKKSQGCILNIGSKVGLTGQGGTSAYAASKGGVLALTREWAVDLVKYNVRVNCIVIAESWTPAYKKWIESIEDGPKKLDSIVSKIPLGNRMTTPEEIANTALFVISKRSSHTTGQYVFVDGGYVHLDRSLLTS